jgi:hypothetical protein
MAKFRVLKNSLLGGQISRDAVGRTDLPQYAHACELLQNMVPLLSGGAYRRPGSLFQDYLPANVGTPSPDLDYAESQSSPPRLFPFIVNNQTAYALLIGTMRFSILQSGGGNPLGLPGGAYIKAYRATGNGAGELSSFLNYGILPYRCKSNAPAVTATDQAIYTRQGGPGAVANTGNNLVPAAILDVADSSQTFDDDIWGVQYCQANDVMFLTHPDYQPQTIYISGGAIHAEPYDYSLTGLALCQSRPYLNQNTTTATMKVTGIIGNQGTLTCSTPFFNPLHGPRLGLEGPGSLTEGAFFALAVAEGQDMTGNNTDSGILFCRVLSVTSSTAAQVQFDNGVPSRYSSGTTTTAWWESAWSNYRGWPKACAIYQQRLCFAATTHQPNALWFTATTAYGVTTSAIAASCKFSALGDGPNQNLKTGATGTLADGSTYSTPHNWVYYPVDDSQGDGQSTGPLGTQPFRISLATTSLDAIQYLSADQQLFIGTAIQEWIAAPANGSFDVANSVCTIQSHYGSDNIQALRIGYELMFVHQKKNEIKAYQYNYFDQSFFGEPVQLFFDEYPLDEEGSQNPYVGRQKYRQLDWDASRSTLWCVDTAGNLFGITRDRKLQISTWHTHQLGGFNAAHGQNQNITDNLSAGNWYTDSANYLCDGSVVSTCTTPNPLSGMRDIWIVVKRSFGTTNQTIWSVERIIGGNTVRRSAYSTVAPGNAQEPLYVDCASFIADNGLYTGSVGAQLAGQAPVGTYYSSTWGMFPIASVAPVASDGSLQLQPNLPADYGSANPHTIIMGLPYSSIVQPVRIDPPSPIGTSQGAIKRPSKAYVRVYKTLYFKMGAPPPGTLETVRFKQPAQIGQSSEIYTGDKEVFLPANFDRAGYVYLLQDQPLPFTLVSLSIEGMEYEQ